MCICTFTNIYVLCVLSIRHRNSFETAGYILRTGRKNEFPQQVLAKIRRRSCFSLRDEIVRTDPPPQEGTLCNEQ